MEGFVIEFQLSTLDLNAIMVSHDLTPADTNSAARTLLAPRLHRLTAVTGRPERFTWAELDAIYKIVLTFSATNRHKSGLANLVQPMDELLDRLGPVLDAHATPGIIAHDYFNASDDPGAFEADEIGRQAVTVAYAWEHMCDCPMWRWSAEGASYGMEEWFSVGLDRSARDPNVYFLENSSGTSSKEVPADHRIYVQRRDMPADHVFPVGARRRAYQRMTGRF